MPQCVNKLTRPYAPAALPNPFLTFIMCRMVRFISCLSVAVASTGFAAAPEAIEIGSKNVADLPGGREADGIIGDFVLRNDHLEAVISGNQHNRKANMAIFWNAPTAGCLYDLTPRGTHNDQLTWFGPGNQQGQLSSVYILKTGDDGEAVVRAELTAAGGDGLGKTHDYVLHANWRHLLVISTYHNETDAAVKIKPAADWKGLVSVEEFDGITTGLCQDPADRIGYAFKPIKLDEAQPATGEIDLQPNHAAAFAVAIAVGKGSADAFGIVAAVNQPGHRFRGRVRDPDNKPVASAALHIPQSGKTLIAYLNDDGRYDLTLPQQTYTASLKDLGRADSSVELTADKEQEFSLPNAAGVSVTVTDDAGGPLPCKVQFIGIDETKMPDLGPIIRAHGCDNQYHSENGRFKQPIPPGRYRAVITRGIEYDHVEKTIDVPPGKIVPIEATLKRVVDTRGWVSTDFHNHSTPSGDNYCGTDDRVINLAAENVEFAPTTEHNRLYDWKPHIDRLGLAPFVATTVGIELTGNGPHLNSFPLQPIPFRQDNGAPQWDPDPRINALALRRHPGDLASRWVQLNHPDIAQYFNDLDRDGKPDGGYQHLEGFIDASEMYGQTILSPEAVATTEYQGKTYRYLNQPFAWMQMLNAGRRIWTVATSDAHQVTGTPNGGGGVGGWRMYVPSRTDEPAAIDPKEIITNAKAGHSFVTSGPFLEVLTSDGHGPGETIVARASRPSSVTLHVRVQCNTWVDIDRVAVLVNGRIDPKLDFRKAVHPELFRSGVVRFEKDLTVDLTGDAHLIVAAVGERSTLETGYGRGHQARWRPAAYHNPIFIDIDGNGFQPNGDTLDQPYLKVMN